MRTTAVQSVIAVLALASGGATGCANHSDVQASSKGNLTKWPGPQFPGAGASGAGQGIAAGISTVTCGGGPPPAGSFGPASGSRAHIQCLYDASSSIAGAIEWIVETAEDAELVHVRLTMNPGFVDNTYGANAIGWGSTSAPGMPAPGTMPPAMGMMPPAMGPHGHKFMDLVGSDHAEFKLSDGSGTLVLHFKADYISAVASALSGYATLGVVGGDGNMILGNASDVVAVSTSLDRDLNACKLSRYTVDSPPTDADYTPSRGAEDWDYRVVYDVWVKQSAFGTAGFGNATVDFVHASPSKVAGKTTIDVTPRDCPPPYCDNPDGCPCIGESCNPPPPPPPPPPPRCGDAPDQSCFDAGVITPVDAGEWKFRPF